MSDRKKSYQASVFGLGVTRLRRLGAPRCFRSSRICRNTPSERTGLVGAPSMEVFLTVETPLCSGNRQPGVKGGKVAPQPVGAQIRPQKRDARRAVSENMEDTTNQRRLIMYCICEIVMATRSVWHLCTNSSASPRRRLPVRRGCLRRDVLTMKITGYHTFVRCVFKAKVNHFVYTT